MRLRRRFTASRQAVYSIVDTLQHVASRRQSCPTCQTNWIKGDTIYRATFAHEPEGFVLRHKLYCRPECVPSELRSR